MTGPRTPVDTRSAVVCESCGARNSVPQGDGRYVCRSCGWVQRAPARAATPAAPRPRRRRWPLVVIGVVLAAGAYAWWHAHRTVNPPTTPATPSGASPAQTSRAGGQGNRQVTVANPPIRVIEPGIDWTLDELLAPALPQFDTSKLELGRFESIIDETGLPTFRAPLTNRSTDTVVMGPIMDLRLFSTDGTTQVPASIGGLPPSLYPGEKAWIKIGDDDDIKPIRRVEVTWHPARSMPLPGPRRKANIEIKNQQLRTCHERIMNGQGDFYFTYPCVDMVGALRNIDTRAMRLTGLAVFFYDDAGRYVGSDSTDLNVTVDPGQTADFELHTKLLRKHGYKRYELRYYCR